MSFSVPLTQVALLFQGLAESRKKVDLLAFHPYLHIDEPTKEKELCTVRNCVIVGLESPHLAGQSPGCCLAAYVHSEPGPEHSLISWLKCC